MIEIMEVTTWWFTMVTGEVHNSWKSSFTRVHGGEVVVRNGLGGLWEAQREGHIADIRHTRPNHPFLPEWSMT